MLIKVINGQYISRYNRLLLELDNPTVEFPIDFLREDNPNLADYNVQICRQFPQPPIDNLTQNIAEKDPEFINGEWVQDWIIWEKTDEEKRNIVPVVSMVQFQMALEQKGQLESIAAMVEAIGGEAAIRWKHSTEVERNAPLIFSFAQQLDWTEAEVNELFQKAVTL